MGMERSSLVISAKNTVDVFHATLNGAAQERLDALVADGTIDEWTGIIDWKH